MSKKEEYTAEDLFRELEEAANEEDTTVWDKENTWNGYPFYKKDEKSLVWWVDNSCDFVGEFIFSFDKKKVYWLFRDYLKLSQKKKKIFDESEPFWAEFFNGKGKDDESV